MSPRSVAELRKRSGAEVAADGHAPVRLISVTLDLANGHDLGDEEDDGGYGRFARAAALKRSMRHR